MVVYNLYLVLNNELIEIYDEKARVLRFEGLSNDIPDNLMGADMYIICILSVWMLIIGY